jgi:hypothetical protein
VASLHLPVLQLEKRHVAAVQAALGEMWCQVNKPEVLDNLADQYNFVVDNKETAIEEGEVVLEALKSNNTEAAEVACGRVKRALTNVRRGKSHMVQTILGAASGGGPSRIAQGAYQVVGGGVQCAVDAQKAAVEVAKEQANNVKEGCRKRLHGLLTGAAWLFAPEDDYVTDVTDVPDGQGKRPRTTE